MLRITCPNKRKDGSYCDATILFVPKDATDISVVLPPCRSKYKLDSKMERCGAMVKVDIDSVGNCLCTVFRERLEASNMPLMSQGVYE